CFSSALTQSFSSSGFSGISFVSPSLDDASPAGSFSSGPHATSNAPTNKKIKNAPIHFLIKMNPLIYLGTDVCNQSTSACSESIKIKPLHSIDHSENVSIMFVSNVNT